MRRLFLVAALTFGCASDGHAPEETVSNDGEEGDDYDGLNLEGKADGFSPPEGPLEFDNACVDGESITIAAVGDVLLHGRLQRQSYADDDQGFATLWHGVADLLRAADITYANFEGPAAEGVTSSGQSVTDPGRNFDDRVYTSYPMFNYHPSLIDDLLASGVDVVSTANNHALDRRSLGADRTIAALREKGLAYTGTRTSDGADEPWHTMTEAGGFSIAWLACTYSTNGIPDREDQVLFCFRATEEIEQLVTELSSRDDVDAVIVTPHFGNEYDANPSNQQVSFAHRMLDAGATAIIGSHPHVTQPWERYVTPDGRETFALYSLGNFVSGQRQLARRSTIILYLGLTRASDGQVVINGARHVPLHMSQLDYGLSAQAIDRVGGLTDSRALTVGMFGGWNLNLPSTHVVTNPQCEPQWTPPPSPHPHDGWIGGSCEDNTTCGGATCLTDRPGGLCTEPCAGPCPDRAGRATTMCADMGVDGTGSCVAQCNNNAECRQGYVCSPTGRFGEPDYIRTVCIPASE